MQAIVMYSGGVGSWAAAMRVVAKYGSAHTTLLFCDTKQEDEDLYRFLHEGAAIVGVPVTIIADGRNPWEVFRGEGYLGNTRFPWCSWHLKRYLADAWLKEHWGAEDCVIYIGMDFCQKERGRWEAMRQRYTPYQVDAPLFWDPPLDKDLAKLLALRHGLRLPRLYEMGFQHNNCGGFCVKAGHEQFALLYRMLPERYQYHMEQEEAFRQATGKNVAILRNRTAGSTKPLTLAALKRRLDESPELPFPRDTKKDEACNCFA